MMAGRKELIAMVIVSSSGIKHQFTGSQIIGTSKRKKKQMLNIVYYIPYVLFDS